MVMRLLSQIQQRLRQAQVAQRHAASRTRFHHAAVAGEGRALLYPMISKPGRLKCDAIRREAIAIPTESPRASRAGRWWSLDAGGQRYSG